MMATVVSLDHGLEVQSRRPSSPIRIDWATGQSESQDVKIPAIAGSRNAFTTPPQKSTGVEAGCTEEIARVKNGVVSSVSKKVYDIPTMMKYRTSFAGIAVFAKIKPEALAGKVDSLPGA